MDFGSIIDRSFKAVRSNSVFWKLGLLAVFTEGMISGSGQSLPMPPGANRTNPADPNMEQWASVMRDWAAQNPATAGLIILTVLLLVVWLWYVSFRAKAGLIKAVVSAEKTKKSPTFAEAFKSGGAFAWPIFGLYLLFGLIATFVIGTVAVVLSSFPDRVILFSLLLLVPLFLVFVGYLSFIMRVAEREIVLEGSKVLASVRLASNLCANNFGSAVLSVLVQIGLTILFGIAIFSLIIISVGLAALVGFVIISILPKIVAVVVLGIVGVLFIAGLFLLSGWFTAFIVTYWTLVFKALKR